MRRFMDLSDKSDQANELKKLLTKVEDKTEDVEAAKAVIADAYKQVYDPRLSADKDQNAENVRLAREILEEDIQALKGLCDQVRKVCAEEPESAHSEWSLQRQADEAAGVVRWPEDSPDRWERHWAAGEKGAHPDQERLPHSLPSWSSQPSC